MFCKSISNIFVVVNNNRGKKMKNVTKKAAHKKKRKKKNLIYLICWLFMPLAALTVLLLDGLGLYPFNAERLIVIGASVLIVLLPFFNEVTVKGFSIKKGKGK